MSGIHLAVDDHALDIVAENGESLLVHCRAGVELSDGNFYTTLDPPIISNVTDAGVMVFCPGTGVRPELRWQIQSTSAPDELVLWLEVHNTTRRALAVERMDILIAPNGFRGEPFAQLEAAQSGWQSWSPATAPLPLATPLKMIAGPINGPMLPASEAERLVSPWLTMLRTAAGDGMLVGFTTARDQTGIVAIQATASGHRLTASSYPDGIALPPGGIMRSEKLQLFFERDAVASTDRYARTLAANMHARSDVAVPTGWCSWYAFFEQVSEADMLRNLEYFATHRSQLPVEYIQIDDGYEGHVGDWLTTNERFPRGMKFLADAIRAEGFKPAIWLSPFLVAQDSEIYAEHPDWVIHDERDEPLVCTPNWEPFNYALDMTHPQALEWVRHVVGTMANDWGYDYIKLDYLYAAALRGKYYDRTATSVQMYRRGLTAVRAAAGEKFLLGCGAPFAPSVGLVDAMRTGPDAASFWRNPRDRIGSLPSQVNVIRANVAHHWMQPHLWVNDPDCAIVRETQSDLSLAEIQTAISLIAFGGGTVMFSDDLPTLEPARAALLPLLIPPYRQAAVPFGPYVDGLAMHMQLRVQRAWEEWLMAGLFNWHDEPRALTFDPAVWGNAMATPYHVFDLWTSEHWGPITGTLIMAPTAAHGVRLLSVHAALNRPQVVGSTLHALGAAAHIANVVWSDNELQLDLRCVGQHNGKVIIYVPVPYLVDSVKGISENDVVSQGELVFLSVALLDKASITIQFR